MLVTFMSDAHENITMFGDVAIRLLKMMGQSGTVPSAIVAKNVPEALENLTAAIEQEKQKPKQLKHSDDDEEPEVSLVHRALPLIDLLKDATTHQCDVLWK